MAIDFRLPHARIAKLDDTGLAQLNRDLLYIMTQLQNYPRQVTFSTNMNTDVSGLTGELVFATTDTKFYGCTSGGKIGSATWAALN